MTPGDFTQLLARYRGGSLSEQEIAALERSLASGTFDDTIRDDIRSLLEEERPHPQWTPEYARFLWQKVLINTIEPAATGKTRFIGKWYRAAAAILLLLSAAGYFWISGSRQQAGTVAADVQPGKNGAVLTLADGSQVTLDHAGDTTVALQGGVTARIKNGVLVYEGVGSKMVYNAISTPRGRQFQLTLPDGTKVWLNSASSIRYPTMFAGKERKVAVTGEVYFEVKKADIPFMVNADNRAEITVLGTRFNLNAYDNEPAIHTTLIEGAVRVIEVVLKPGQQARLKRGGQLILIENVDVDKVIAWKNGVFNFDKVPFAEAMRQLERWYDIDVVYENGVPADIELVGKITKGVTLNNLTMALRKIGVKCRLEGKKLIITN